MIENSNLTNLTFGLNEQELVVSNKCDITLNNKNKSSVRLTDCYLKGADPTDFGVCPDYSNLVIKQEDVVIFEGVVKLTSYENISNIGLKTISLQALSGDEWLSSHTPITFLVKNVDPKEVVQKVIDVVSDYRIKIGTLNFGVKELLKKYKVDNAKAYDIFEYLANYTNSKWNMTTDGLYFYINFYDYENLPITENLTLFYDKKENHFTCSNPEITKITYQGARVVDYCNQVLCISEKVIFDTPIITTFFGDGKTTDFTVNPGVYKIKRVGIKKRTDKNWQQVACVPKNLSDSVIAAFYYEGQTISQNQNDDPLSADYEILFEYFGIGKSSYQADNISEQKRIAKINNVNEGVRCKVIKKDDAIYQTDLVNYAEGQLAKYSKPYRPLVFSSQNKPVKNWIIGAKISIDSPDQDILKDDYIITQIKINGIGSDDQVVASGEYHMVPSLNDDQPINFYDNKKALSDTPDTNEIDIYKNIKKLVTHNINYKISKIDASDFKVKNLEQIQVFSATSKLILDLKNPQLFKEGAYQIDFTLTEEVF